MADHHHMLQSPTWEVIPLPGVERQLCHLPPGATVAITCSPDRGVAATIDLAARLLGRGFTPVPHLAARMVRDRGHLEEILQRLKDLQLRRLFVIGGDAEQTSGDYDSTLQLLRAMAEIDHGVAEVGIGAYPEGHPFITDTDLVEILRHKQPLATYMVTQMCFDAKAILRWLRGMREVGIELPVKLGLPGVTAPARLLQIAVKIGVGPSARFLKSHLKLVSQMVKPGGFTPDELLQDLTPHLTEQAAGIVGLHLFTFNQLRATARWHSRLLGLAGPNEA